jgi:hypothetical protein
MKNLTPIQIALLAMAYENRIEAVAVWGSWQKAAQQLAPALILLGTERGTREMEWRTLHGRHRRGKEGRLVHLYKLATNPHAVELAARCAWAVAHLSKGRQHATWKDVPVEVPTSPWPDGRACRGCFCSPDEPCTVELPDGCGEANCVPAGAFGFERCSACQTREAA